MTSLRPITAAIPRRASSDDAIIMRGPLADGQIIQGEGSDYSLIASYVEYIIAGDGDSAGGRGDFRRKYEKRPFFYDFRPLREWGLTYFCSA